MNQEINRTRLEVYIHLVWATHRRMKMITPTRERSAHHLLQSQAKAWGCNVLAIGGTDDHVHLLIKFNSTVSLGQLVKQLKGVSSRALSEQMPTEPFRWQDGYSATSIHRELIPTVKEYIRIQKAHHFHGTIKPDLEVSTPCPGE